MFISYMGHSPKIVRFGQQGWRAECTGCPWQSFICTTEADAKTARHNHCVTLYYEAKNNADLSSWGLTESGWGGREGDKRFGLGPVVGGRAPRQYTTLSNGRSTTTRTRTYRYEKAKVRVPDKSLVPVQQALNVSEL